ncbi:MULTISPECIES: FtsX-like permease family protein [unclassified Ekhidna]|jgi:putative ABC transport system permease protein|uniref:ABC transporter permease n=1 Tax=unclassified Ekhidna TaxID=2632188 RepID=UPI0032DFF657
MNLFSLSIKNVFAKPLSSLLSVLLFGFGVAIIVSILLTSTFLKNEINKNAQGIDLVIGAKGSPLQIILASIFHIDFPTGNISLSDANNLTRNRLVASAIPLSLGDSYQGYRIVGTTEAYPQLYEASLATGDWFGPEMTATVGATIAKNLGIKVGDQLESAHGLSEGAGGHEEHPFTVVGIMEPSGSVLDQLILVSVQSVWEVHSGHEEHDHEEGGDHHELVSLDRLGLEVTKEQLENEDITSLLIKYRSPMAAVQLPRIVNGTSNLQAASPPYETARLFNIIGVGVDVVNMLGLVIIILSATSVFIALINSLKERKYELAIMRSMGASQLKIFLLILTEGIVLTIIGSAFGFALAHLGFAILVDSMEQIQSSGMFFVFDEYKVMLGSLTVGIFASIIPAFLAYKSDISETLSKA